jgi:hypothetical protein
MTDPLPEAENQLLDLTHFWGSPLFPVRSSRILVNTLRRNWPLKQDEPHHYCSIVRFVQEIMENPKTDQGYHKKPRQGVLYDSVSYTIWLYHVKLDGWREDKASITYCTKEGRVPIGVVSQRTAGRISL